ncbi:hypothetical protein BGAL_0150g00110 [Botrytis galanthina]|uniref:Uncharacterized protein n=1 Tax=Botrytis galanthina TaxID=278940 RepID=A0A4S8QYF2_9HELO|nr:hypothetical protein BGAL_0150g00110 [Botrytis galanthina]
MSAQLEYNGQAADEASQDNGFPEDFDEIFNEGFEKETAAALLAEQEAAAAALLAPEPQAENGQVDEEVDDNGFPADFHVEFDEEFEKDKRNAAAAPVAPVLPVAPLLPVLPVAPVVLAPQPRANDALTAQTYRRKNTTSKTRKGAKNGCL